MNLGIAGKTAIVSAASRGIGKAIALGLAKEGVNMVICARNEAGLRKTAQEIEDKFGAEGPLALRLFNKMKLVETRWQQPPEGSQMKPVKAYHTYYSAFHINTSCSVFEISDVIAAAGMSEKDYKKVEAKILKLIGTEGMFAGDVAEELKISQTMLKSLVKRSAKFDYRGHRIETHEEE